MKLLVLVLLVACDNGEVTPDWSRMIEQPATRSFGRFAMAQPPAGVVPREHDQQPAAELLERGRERFAISCAACHGIHGDGESPVAHAMQRRRPPSLREPRIIAMSADQIDRVIREGYGLMPQLGDLLPEPDRLAVIAYLRTLEGAP